MQHHSVTGIKLVWEQENPIQEKHRQVPRRGQHVRSEDRSQCNQRVCSRQPGKLPINSQLSRWIPFAMLSARPADTVTASQPARCTVHRASTQMVAGKMLRLLRQWHRPQKDPEAFIRILPTEYIHLYTSSTKKHGLTLIFTVLNKKEFTAHSLGRCCEILTRKKISNISSAYNVGHLGYEQSFTIKVKTIPQSTETFVQISHYIQRAGVTYSLVMFSLIMMKWYDKVNKSNHWF